MADASADKVAKLRSDLAASEMAREHAESLLRAIQEGEVDSIVTDEGLTHLIPDAAKLAEANQMMHGIVGAIAVAVIVIDEHGLIQHWNPAAERIFGYTPEEATGQNVSMLMPEPFRSEHDGYLQHYFQTGEHRVIGQIRDVTAQRKDGEEFPAQLRVNEMVLGSERMFVGSIIDISARVETERELSLKRRTLQAFIEKGRAAATKVEGIKRLVFVRTLIALLVMGLVLAAATILPLYKDLQARNSQEVEFIIEARMASVEQYLSKITNIAEQIASRTEARRQLVRFNEGEINRADLIAFSQHILQDALENSAEVAGVTRLDRRGETVMVLGQRFPWDVLASIDPNLRNTTIYDSVRIDDETRILVAVPIRERDGSKVGIDIILFETGDLQSIIQDYIGLGETGELILGRIKQGRFISVFDTRRPYEPTAFAAMLDDLVADGAGTGSGQRVACAGCVVSVRSLAYVDWYLVFRMDEGELNAIIDVTVLRILAVVAVILVLGMVGIYSLTYPLLRTLSGELKERIRAEAASQQSAVMYRALFEGAGDAIFLVDPESKRFVEVNQVGCKQLGYTRNELLGMGPTDIADPERGVKPADIFEILDERGSYTFEHVHRRKGGIPISVEITASVVEWSGRRVYQAVVRDATTRKEAEQKIRVQEEQLRAYFHHVPAAVAVFDRDMRYLAVSQRWLEDYNLKGLFTKESIVGESHYDIFPEIGEDWKVLHQRTIGGEPHFSDEDTFPRADGGVDWIRWYLHPWKNADGDIGGIIMFTEVITEKKETAERAHRAELERERADAANAAKSEFLSTVSHELRTPLTTVLGNMPPLLEDLTEIQKAEEAGDCALMPDVADTIAMVQEIGTEGEHLLDLINDTLDIAKIEAGQLALERVDLDMNEIVESVCQVLSGRAAHQGLTLIGEVPDEEVIVSADYRRLRQVLINLVGNAIKFTEEGGITITLRKEVGNAVCTVRDTGRGIAEADLQRVFEKFQQVGTRKEGGTGLGLAITRQLVELHGGEISVESTLGEGSVFTFAVPLNLGE